MQAAHQNIHSIRTPFGRRTDLRTRNLQLQAEIDALIEDNKQLRAALRIFSEVARKSPACLEIDGELVA